MRGRPRASALFVRDAFWDSSRSDTTEIQADTAPPGFLGINTVAFVGSVEQPITEWLDVVVEWYSGEEHEFAYLIPGAVLHVEDWTFVLGYKLANSPEEKDTESVVVEVGRTL